MKLDRFPSAPEMMVTEVAAKEYWKSTNGYSHGLRFAKANPLQKREKVGQGREEGGRPTGKRRGDRKEGQATCSVI